MEHIPRYDTWKTKPPEPPDITECVRCGKEIYKYDELETVDGYKCEDCIRLED